MQNAKRRPYTDISCNNSGLKKKGTCGAKIFKKQQLDSGL